MIIMIRFLLMLCLVGLPVRSDASYTFDLTDSFGRSLGDLVLPVADCQFMFGPGSSFTECPAATIDFDTGLNLYKNSTAFQVETTGWHFDGTHFTGLSQAYFVLDRSPDEAGLSLDLTQGYFYEYHDWLSGGQGDPPIASGPVTVTLVASQDIPEPRFLGFLTIGLLAPVVLASRLRRPYLSDAGRMPVGVKVADGTATRIAALGV